MGHEQKSAKTFDSYLVPGKEVWLRKAAEGKEEYFMAFQGKKRILYYVIQITSVLPLMNGLVILGLRA